MTDSQQKRVKVAKTHKRKLFFEKFLFDWKNDVDDRNLGAVLWKAYTCMKRYPLELDSGEEAKLLKGCLMPQLLRRMHSMLYLQVWDL
jgi:hypothetical protein